MNEIPQLGGLSYKELQALAHEYKIPRNIRKHMLIKVLEAVRQGNDSEVKNILKEIRQNRKKREKRCNKPLKSLSYLGTSINLQHDADYRGTMYYSGELSQVHREVVGLNDEELRMPNGLKQGGQDSDKVVDTKVLNQQYSPSIGSGYLHCDNYIEHLDRRSSQSPTIVDLRKNPYRVDEQSNGVLSATGYQNMANNHQIMAYESPRLLKKILQAPAGANLKQLINYENSYNISSVNSNIFDDSDTLTAESESNFNDNRNDNENFNDWFETNHNGNTTNGIDGDCQTTDYYRHDSLYNRQTNIVDNCQKWLVNSSSLFAQGSNLGDDFTNYAYNDQNRMQNFLEKKNLDDCQYYYHNDGQYCSLDNTENNDNNTNNNNNDENHYGYQCQEQTYYGDVNLVEGTLSTNIYDNNDNNHNINNNDNILMINSHGASQQWATQCASNLPIPSANQQFYHNQNSCQAAIINNTNNDIMEHVAPESNYDKVNLTLSQSCINNDYGQANDAEDIANTTTNPEQLDPSGNPEFNSLSSIMVENNVFVDYWPKWNISKSSRIEANAVHFKLENLLNLQNIPSNRAETKSKTDCVYCYTSPIATQRESSTHEKMHPSFPLNQQDYTSNAHQVSLIDTESPLNSTIKSHTITTSTSSIKEQAISCDRSLPSVDLWLNDYSTIDTIHITDHCNSL